FAVALCLGLLAYEFAQLVVRDLESELVRSRLERQLPRERLPGLRRDALLYLLGRLVGNSEVGLDGDAAALERLDEAREQPVRAGSDETLGRLDVRCLDERVDGGGTELGLDLGVELLAQARLDVGAQLRQRVELAGRFRELVVER